MAKTELIQARYGKLLVRLGAFPGRRGPADEDALETPRIILRQGGLLALFPEGTRIRDPDNLGHPRRGAGRLALETGAPLVPCAITGTEKIFRGGVPVPRRVQVAFSEPIEVRELPAGPASAPRLAEGVLWAGGGGGDRRPRADRGAAVAGGRGGVPPPARPTDHHRRLAGRARNRRRPVPPPQTAAVTGVWPPPGQSEGACRLNHRIGA